MKATMIIAALMICSPVLAAPKMPATKPTTKPVVQSYPEEGKQPKIARGMALKEAEAAVGFSARLQGERDDQSIYTLNQWTKAEKGEFIIRHFTLVVVDGKILDATATVEHFQPKRQVIPPTDARRP